ncbi:MAG: 3-dehydroquinate synthase [Actinobacteria bacterium]|nr:3-dehydroquinate synthase [Actinomycetota bacterium]
MSRTIPVKAEHDYEIVIGCQWRDELISVLSNYRRAVVVVSESMGQRVSFPVAHELEIQIVNIPDGEDGKSAENLEKLWKAFGDFGLTRSDVVVAIGGGATTDIAGFAAATWLRGISWIAIPTTLAGMVDAAIGGKTGMNSEFGKNLIGAFHSPHRVLIDLSWLDTLSDRDFSAGMAEVIKCGFISDAEILNSIEGKNLLSLRSDRGLTEELIGRAAMIKADVVVEDFRESFAREVLNYGHTMGHAIELHSNYSLRHGEAVSIGMVFIAELAHLKGLLSTENVERHRKILSDLGLPVSYPQSAFPELLPLLFRDKKTRGRMLRFIAISDGGEVVRLESVAESEILAAYERVGS